MSKQVWSTALLDLLHAPRSPQNYQFLNQWASREHNGGPALSDGSNNPFFTTAGAGGTVGPLKAGTFPDWNSVGVARYPSLEVGVYANALHIQSQYPAIAQALRSGNPAAYSSSQEFQRELTTWSGGGYSGFASIPAAAGPVGPDVDSASIAKDVTKATQGGGSGFLHSILGDQVPGEIGGAIGGAINRAAGPLGKGPTVGDVAGGVGSAAKFLGRLTDPSYILRGLQIVAGGVLVGGGLLLLARQVGLAADLPDPARFAGGGVPAAAGVD